MSSPPSTSHFSCLSLKQVDLIESYGQLDFNLDFYTEVQDLSRLVDAMGTDRFSRRFRKLSSGLCEVRCCISNSSTQPHFGLINAFLRCGWVCTLK